jgi:peptidoglycan DL-endopeptidase RipA
MERQNRRAGGRAAWTRRLAAVAIPMLTLMTPALDGPRAAAQPGLDDRAGAVAAAAEASQRVADARADIQARQEHVNELLAHLESARDAAADAQHAVDDRRDALLRLDADIATAQRRFDQFAASTYVEGPSPSYLGATDPADLLATLQAGRALAVGEQQSLTDLRRARSREANAESVARAAREQAATTAAEAQRAQDAAVAELVAVQQDFANLQSRLDKLEADRRRAQQAVQLTSGTIGDGSWDTADRPPAAAGSQQWDTTLPMVPSANVTADPLAVVNSILGVASNSAKVTADLGRSFLSSLGLAPASEAGGRGGFANGAIPRVYGRQASEYVIRRAMSQVGVPYSWGGGSAAGPSRGIDSGAGTVGFDCSGIVLYAFAGVGIKLPHYSGDQYNAGRKIPSAQMRRGDVIFYGPNASQHEALYLGQGMMLESPYTGSDVHISPVRTTGMTPYVTRFIEY